jgi:hypothetical protein
VGLVFAIGCGWWRNGLCPCRIGLIFGEDPLVAFEESQLCVVITAEIKLVPHGLSNYQLAAVNIIVVMIFVITLD